MMMNYWGDPPSDPDAHLHWAKCCPEVTVDECFWGHEEEGHPLCNECEEHLSFEDDGCKCEKPMVDCSSCEDESIVTWPDKSVRPKCEKGHEI